jgi:RNA polymerase sigma-70 factor, ECF subfamily
MDPEGMATPSHPLAEPAAFRQMYEAEAGYVLNRLRRLGVPERDLEDKVQDVFLVAYRQLDSHDRVRPIRLWLVGISVRVALDHRRLARHYYEVPTETIEVADGGRGPEASLARKQAQAMVLAALEDLPAEQRVVFVLKELEGFSMPEIEQVLDVPLNTLYSRLRLARERFCAAARARESRAVRQATHG